VCGPWLPWGMERRSCRNLELPEVPSRKRLGVGVMNCGITTPNGIRMRYKSRAAAREAVVDLKRWGRDVSNDDIYLCGHCLACHIGFPTTEKEKTAGVSR
jgi:hypothetical protein